MNSLPKVSVPSSQSLSERSWKKRFRMQSPDREWVLRPRARVNRRRWVLICSLSNLFCSNERGGKESVCSEPFRNDSSDVLRPSATAFFRISAIGVISASSAMTSSHLWGQSPLTFQGSARSHAWKQSANTVCDFQCRCANLYAWLASPVVYAVCAWFAVIVTPFAWAILYIWRPRLRFRHLLPMGRDTHVLQPKPGPSNAGAQGAESGHNGPATD